MCDIPQWDKQCLVADLQSGISLQEGSRSPLDNTTSDGSCIPEGSIWGNKPWDKVEPT